MAQVNLVEKKIQMGYQDIIRYQLITQCFIERMPISDSELKCLTLLGIEGESELAEFCTMAVDKGVFKTPQTVRNFLTKAEKSLGLVVKTGTSRKKILLNPDLKIQTAGNILLNYKILYIAT